MIAYITGKLLEIFGNTCLVLTPGGTGYEIALTAPTLASLPAPGEEVKFYTWLAVREDALELYGFTTFAERQAFAMLTGISRVGCRTALAILSIHSPDDLARIVAEEDIPALSRVSGIGAKTAQHIFLELKFRLKSSATGKTVSRIPSQPSILRDVLDGLANLGYDENECLETVRSVVEGDKAHDVGSALRATLKALAARRK